MRARRLVLLVVLATPNAVAAQAAGQPDCPPPEPVVGGTSNAEEQGGANRAGVRCPEEPAAVAAGRSADAAPPPARPVERELVAPWEISSQLGMYFPVGTLVGSESAPAGMSKRQAGAGLVKARVVRRIARHFGIEGSVAFSPSFVAVRETRPPNSTVVDLDSRVVMASARGVVRFGSRNPAGELTLHLASGVGVVSRFGSAWADSRGTTDPALVLGAGAQLAIRGSRVSFRLDLDDYVSSAQFQQGTAGPTAARIHHDLMWLVGASLPLGAR